MIFQIVGPFANLLIDFDWRLEEVFLIKIALFSFTLLYFFFAAISFRHVLILNKMVRARGVGFVKILAFLNLAGALLLLISSLGILI